MYLHPSTLSRGIPLRQFLRAAVVLLVLAASLVAITPQEADATWKRGCRPAIGQLATTSNYDFEETWGRLLAALNANPNIGIVDTVDHAAAARSAGLELDPNRVVFFGNPALGSPLMAANRQIGLDLPQKIQVWQTGDTVCVGYNSTDYLNARHHVSQVPTLSVISGALSNLVTAASGNTPSRWSGCWWCIWPLYFRDGVTTQTSDADFETTWNRLLGAIGASPANVAFTVDHGANSGGLLPPTRLVVFGNPAIGTPIMDANPTAGIDLPLKILVWEDDKGVVQVSTNEPDLLAFRHWLWYDRDVLTPVNNATNNFLAAATGG